MKKYDIVYSYFENEDHGFRSDYEFALSFILSHHTFISALASNMRLMILHTNAKNFFLKDVLHFDSIEAPAKNFTKPTIKIESDTYLFKTFPSRVFNSPVFYDYVLRNNPEDVEAFKKCKQHISFKDPIYQSILKNADSIWSVECGVFGGQPDILNELQKYLNEFATDNFALIKHTGTLPAFKRLIENILPYYFFKEKGYNLDVLVNRDKETEPDLFRHQMKNYNYVRLYGDSKKNPFMIEAVEKFVSHNYPYSYDKIKRLK